MYLTTRKTGWQTQSEAAGLSALVEGKQRTAKFHAYKPLTFLEIIPSNDLDLSEAVDSKEAYDQTGVDFSMMRADE